MLSWDFDLDSKEGRAGKANSGRNDGLLRGLLGRLSDACWLRARLWCVERGTFQIGRLLTSGSFGCAETGDARGDVWTPVDTIPTRCGMGDWMFVLAFRVLSLAS